MHRGEVSRRRARVLGPIALFMCVFALGAVYLTASQMGNTAGTDRRKSEYLTFKEATAAAAERQAAACSEEVARLAASGAGNDTAASAQAAFMKREVDRYRGDLAEQGELEKRGRRVLLDCEKEVEKLQTELHGASGGDPREAKARLLREEADLKRHVQRIEQVPRSILDMSEGDREALISLLAWVSNNLLVGSQRENATRECMALWQRERYSVVFDIGSTGNRVHVYKFVAPAATATGAGGGNGQQPEPGRLLMGDVQQQQQQSRRRSASVWGMTLQSELFEQNHLALSKRESEEDIVGALADLAVKALAAIPREAHRCTPLEFKATAGLRKLGAARAERTLSIVKASFLESSPLWLRGEAPARILEGREEGPLAWVTVNYLLGNFAPVAAGPPKGTAAVIDLGGGSTQIVVEPAHDRRPAGMTPAHEYSAVLGGRWVTAYQHSYEGLGLHEGARALMMEVQGKCAGPVHHRTAAPSPPDGDYGGHQFLGADGFHGGGDGGVVAAPPPSTPRVVHNANATATHFFPCFAAGYADEAGVANSNSSAGADFDSCVALFRTYVLDRDEGDKCPRDECGMRGQPQPSLAAFEGPIYAFSFVYDLMNAHRPAGTHAGGTITPAHMAAVGRRRCAEITLQSIAKARAAAEPSSLKPEYDCMYYSYLYALLRHGYGIPEDRPLTVAKKIKGFETAWTLGAALMTLSSLAEAPGDDVLPVPHFLRL